MTTTAITALGFTVTGSQYQQYRTLMGSEYGSVAYCDRQDYVGMAYIFIYKKETLNYCEIAARGPDYIDQASDGTLTCVSCNPNITKLLSSEIDTVKTHFNLQKEKCALWTIVTTWYVSELENHTIVRDGDVPFNVQFFETFEEYCEENNYEEGDQSSMTLSPMVSP